MAQTDGEQPGRPAHRGLADVSETPDEHALAEMRRRATAVAGFFLVAHFLYTAFQFFSLVLSLAPPFVDRDVLRTSFLVNLSLDVVTACYLAFVGLAPRAGPWLLRLLPGATIVLWLVAMGVWGVQLHHGGSQSSPMFALVLASVLVVAWVLPARTSLALAGVAVAYLVAIVALEAAGVLPYAPLLPDMLRLSSEYLDWRILTMNAVICGFTLVVSLWTMLALRKSVREGRRALRRNLRRLEREVAERERAQQTLRGAVERLTTANEQLRGLIRAATHDLRSPLTVIGGYTSLIGEGLSGGPGDDMRLHLIRVEEGVQHMRQLLDDLSRLVLSNGAEVPLVGCDAGAVAARVVGLFELEARQAGATVEVGPLPLVLADPGRLAQVFQNLVGNALKFRSGASPWVRIEAEVDPGGMARFAVHDNGIGIDGAQTERVFEPFVRLVPGDRYEGNGIGLSVCRMAVESMGGRIWAEPRRGGGTTFRFTLWTASGEPARPAADINPPP